MKVFEFNKYFPEEATCRRSFKEMRDKQGVTCQHCGSHDVSVVGEQAAIPMQALSPQDYAQKRHGDARL